VKRGPTSVGATTVAGPRLPPPRETYTGAELGGRPVRDGADEAARLPSLVSGRRVVPAQLRQELHAPLTAPAVPTARAAACVADLERQAPTLPPLTRGRCKSIRAYKPREGSIPHRVLQHLQEHGGYLLYTEISTRFNVERHMLTAIFKPALVRDALIRVQVGKARALALPGYVPPAAEAPAPAPARATVTPIRVVPPPAAAAHHAADVRITLALADTLRGIGQSVLDAADLLRRLAGALPSSPSHHQ